ncbi:MAG: hypothetical protein DRP16_02535 [Candidatus Aenigmatarchaeota archaeon]|nr:MAG: hypothetical protein DRP16_02535 [Candidatus Aenigmarchaeota archaeon]
MQGTVVAGVICVLGVSGGIKGVIGANAVGGKEAVKDVWKSIAEALNKIAEAAEKAAKTELKQ